MASKEETDSFDISTFELQLREKINELQWKSDNVREAQNELSETRKLLYHVQTQLEDERRLRKQLEIEVETCNETARQLEDEKSKKQSDYLGVKMKCQTMSLERDVLIEQTRITTFENMDLKMKNQEYETSLENEKMMRETLDLSLEEFKSRVSRLHTYFQSSTVSKLEREQEQLKNSFENAMKFGSRLRCIIKNNQVMRERDMALIEELKNQIQALERSSLRILPISPEISDTLQAKMEVNIEEFQRRLNDTRVDDKLNLIITDLKRMETRLVEDQTHFLDD